MAYEMICNVAPDQPMPTLEEMLASVESTLAVPQPIGQLMGAVVYLHHDTREVSFGATRCSVDHPYLAGTKIRAAALDALGE